MMMMMMMMMMITDDNRQQKNSVRLHTLNKNVSDKYDLFIAIIWNAWLAVFAETVLVLPQLPLSRAAHLIKKWDSRQKK